MRLFRLLKTFSIPPKTRAEEPLDFMFTNRKKIHIEWGDCDPAGIVYYPRYFAYFDNCTAALFEAAGCPKHVMLPRYEIVGIPMVDTRARFIVPSRFGDEVEVESGITEWRRSSFDVQHRLYRGTQLAVECFETRVWAALSGAGDGKIEGRPVPEEVIHKLGGARRSHG
jgi:4-hydroxybenzoyl-CoA thioesterase